MNKIYKKYMSQLKNSFPYIRKPEKEYLKTLSAEIKDYCDTNDPESIEELYDNCGLPLDTVRDYYSQFEPDDIITKLNFSVIIKRFTLCIIILLFICIATSIVASYKMQQATINELCFAFRTSQNRRVIIFY